jgi:hypothetical protein
MSNHLLVTHFANIGWFADHHCSKLVTHFANIGWFSDHHCSKLVNHFANIGWFVNDGEQFNQY